MQEPSSWGATMATTTKFQPPGMGGQVEQKVPKELLSRFRTQKSQGCPMILAPRIGGQASTGCPGLPRGQNMPVCSVPCRRGASFHLPFIPVSTSQYHELTQDALYTFFWMDCLGPLEGSPKRATEQLRRPKPSF